MMLIMMLMMMMMPATHVTINAHGPRHQKVWCKQYDVYTYCRCNLLMLTPDDADSCWVKNPRLAAFDRSSLWSRATELFSEMASAKVQPDRHLVASCHIKGVWRWYIYWSRMMTVYKKGRTEGGQEIAFIDNGSTIYSSVALRCAKMVKVQGWNQEILNPVPYTCFFPKKHFSSAHM